MRALVSLAERDVESFAAAGLRISAISEPPVVPDTPPELLPHSEFDPTRFIGFIFFSLETVV